MLLFICKYRHGRRPPPLAFSGTGRTPSSPFAAMLIMFSASTAYSSRDLTPDRDHFFAQIIVVLIVVAHVFFVTYD